MPSRTGPCATTPSPERDAAPERADPGPAVCRRSVAAAAALVLLALFVLPQSARAQTEIWNATLTVGSSGSSVGFFAAPPRGALSDTTFEIGGVEFTVRALFVGARSTDTSSLCVLFQSGYQPDFDTATALHPLTLEVAGHVLPFERLLHDTNPGRDYCWVLAGAVGESGFVAGAELRASIATRALQPRVEIARPPLDRRFYRSGEIIRVLMHFEEDVRVTGAPQLELDIGGAARLADHVPGRRGRVVAFEYTVTAADADADGLSIRANTDDENPSLLLNDGEFLWVSFLRGQIVSLGFDALPASAGYAVDGANADTTAPTLAEATVHYRQLVLAYSEPLRSDPHMAGVAASAWSVTVNGAAAALASATITGSERVYLALQSAVDHDDVVGVSSSVLMQDRAATPNTEPALLDGHAVTNVTPAQTPVVEIAAAADAYFEGESIVLTVSRTGGAADRLAVRLDYSAPALLDYSDPLGRGGW